MFPNYAPYLPTKHSPRFTTVKWDIMAQLVPIDSSTNTSQDTKYLYASYLNTFIIVHLARNIAFAIIPYAQSTEFYPTLTNDPP